MHADTLTALAEFVALADAWLSKSHAPCRDADGQFASCGTASHQRRTHGRWRAQERRRKPRDADHADWLRHFHKERRDTGRYLKRERRDLRKEQRKERRELNRDSRKEARQLKARHAREAAKTTNPARTAERHREERSDLAETIRNDRRDKREQWADERRDLRQSHRETAHSAIEDLRTSHAEYLRGKLDERHEAREEATSKGWKAERRHATVPKADAILALERVQASADRLLAAVENRTKSAEFGVKNNTHPCRDEDGQFASCGVSGGGKKPKKKPRKPHAPTASAPPSAPAISRGKARQAYANAQEHHVATAVGGKALKDYEPTDVVVPKPGGKGNHVVEVKSMLDGSQTKISVHANAWVRKADYARKNPKDTFHTIVVDKRNEFEDGAHAAKYSGHEVYYKRASGPYALEKMYKCRDLAHAKELMETPTAKLPKAAKGNFPKAERLATLRAKAEEDRAYNNARSKARKQRLGASAYGR